MAALVHLYPTLAQDITKRHAVVVTGFQETSIVLKLEGAISAVKEARIEIDTLLKKINVTWLTPAFPPSIFPLAKAQLKRDECTVYIFVPEMTDDPTAFISGMVAICTIDVNNREKAVTLVQSTPKEEEILLPNAVKDKGSIDKSLKQLEDKFCIMIKWQGLQENQLQGCQLEDTKITILGFQEQGIRGAKEELQNLIKTHSEQTITFDCKPEEVIYLLKVKGEESRSLFSSLPAKVIIKDNEIQLFGSIESIEKSKEKIRGGPLLDLHCKRFQFQCNFKFLSQMKESLLKPLKAEQKLPFQWLIIQSQSRSSSLRKSDNETKSESCTEADGFDIIIYSKDKSAFDKVCESLEVADPQTVQFQLTCHQRHEAAECARRLKGSLEAKYHVRIIVLQNNSAVIMHGLIPEETQKCWEDIKSEIKATISITKHLPLKKHESKYLERKKCDNLKREFNCDVAFPQPKSNESYAVRIIGKIKDVEAVEDKLSQLKAGIEMRMFTITCSQKSYFMWRKWWCDIQKQKEDAHDVIIHFDISGRRMSRDGRPTVEVTFEVIATDKDVLVSIQDTINNEKTEQRTFDIFEEGKVALVNAMKQQRLPISNKLAIAIDIDQVANKVMLVSPKSLSDDLNTAESEIRKFVGMYANISKEITSQDPVVGLVLASSSLSSTYLKLAEDIAKPLKVNVIAVGAPLFGLRLTGSPSAIQRVEPQIRAIVFQKIEKILGQTWLKIPSNQAPVLATSEFSQMETKFQNDYCVILSYPRPGLSSKAVHTTVINPSQSSQSLQLDICLGNIVYERVDAIVNAANEDLKHIGGLAKDILDSGGVTIQSESNQYVQSHGKVLTGTCVCLGAGKLPCKRIIHAVGPQWRGGGKGEEQTLYNTIYKCLECADKESLSSIALPAISTGVYGVPEVVSARASLTAARNYCHSTANTNITKIRFVLYTKSALQRFGSAFKYMFLSQSHTSTELVTPTPPDPEVADTWSWENDQRSFSSYSSDIAARLTKEYKRDPTGSVICTINRQTYRIDFNSMIQTNCSTRYQRKIQRVPNSQASLALDSCSNSNPSIHWEYRDDHRHWMPYKTYESQAIEEMYRDNTPGELKIGGNTYTFNFMQMYQINTKTNYKRQIQRVKPPSSASECVVDEESTSEQDKEVHTDLVSEQSQHQSSDGEAMTVTLRGPHDNLQLARTELKEKVKSLYVSHTVVFPPALDKKLTELVKGHNVTWSFEMSSSRGKRKKRQKIFKLHVEGLASEVTNVVMAINEEIVTYQVESESDGTAIEYPEEWDDMADATTKLFPLNPDTDEWRHVSQKFQATMRFSRIIQITRIQNKWQWEKYVFQRKRMHKKNDGKINELELFHGTRTNDPKLIYDNEIGFDMRYSNSGMWGLANYFAENASYSNSYAHRSYDGYSEMFFAKVLTGDSFDCRPDSSLRKPPFKPTGHGSTGGGLQFSQVQYDTVTGYTSGSQVYMTYDNEKAYPAYLIKYQ